MSTEAGVFTIYVHYCMYMQTYTHPNTTYMESKVVFSYIKTTVHTYICTLTYDNKTSSNGKQKLSSYTSIQFFFVFVTFLICCTSYVFCARSSNKHWATTTASAVPNSNWRKFCCISLVCFSYPFPTTSAALLSCCCNLVSFNSTSSLHLL